MLIIGKRNSIAIEFWKSELVERIMLVASREDLMEFIVHAEFLMKNLKQPQGWEEGGEKTRGGESCTHLLVETISITMSGVSY